MPEQRDKMTVKVVDRAAMSHAWGGPGPYRVITRTVEIDPVCPVCGGPRGKPYFAHYYEGGCPYSVSRWENPCGHLDKYEDVLKEARGEVSA